VTDFSQSGGRVTKVSIHTPTKGVTYDDIRKYIGRLSFNPHTHEGCDKRRFRFIHTTKSFNPHTHEGCDLKIKLFMYHLFMFQSTHPRRV